MGKDWLYRSSSGSGRRSTKRERLGGGGAPQPQTHNQTDHQSHTPSGCMSSVFQLFDFHQFQFALHRQVPSFNPTTSFLPPEDHPTILKGVEAPRNSLEMEEPFVEAADSFSSIMKEEEETLNIHPMGIQIIKTRGCGTGRSEIVGGGGEAHQKARLTYDLSSEFSNSPGGAKTPNLVARLMGLDLIPDYGCSSSSSSSNYSAPSNPPSKSHQIPNRQVVIPSRSSGGRSFYDADIISGTRSLPETPRISSARRSDVDHHRLSLQINKENVVGVISEESELSGDYSYSAMKIGSRRREIRQEDETSKSSPGHYARQIVKQVKESVGRKIGVDITNTMRNREIERKDQVVLLKAKKVVSKGLVMRVVGSTDDQSGSSKQSTPSCSPRLRFLEVKNKPVSTPTTPKRPSSSVEIQQQSDQVSIKGKPQTPKEQEQQQQQQQQQQQSLNNNYQKCKKIASERYTSTTATTRLKKPPQTSDVIRNKQEEPFVRSLAANRANLSDKKCKKTPLSSELLNLNVPTLFPVKKDTASPATKLPQKQLQVCDALSSKRSTQLSSCLSQTYDKKQEATHPLTVQDSNSYQDSSNGTTTKTTTITTITTSNSGSDRETEYQYYYYYISEILKHTGIDINGPVSLTKWYSPAHPLDPSIFHHLEHQLSFPINPTTNDYYYYYSSELSQHSNRKLIFQLVDEILVEILRPYLNLKPWATVVLLSSSLLLLPPYHHHHHQMCGSQLIDALCSKIRSFPLADCRVLEDIEALIEKDLCVGQNVERSMGFELEEREGIVEELEREIVGSLVHEYVVELVSCMY